MKPTTKLMLPVLMLSAAVPAYADVRMLAELSWSGVQVDAAPGVQTTLGWIETAGFLSIDDYGPGEEVFEYSSHHVYGDKTSRYAEITADDVTLRTEYVSDEDLSLSTVVWNKGALRVTGQGSVNVRVPYRLSYAGSFASDAGLSRSKVELHLRHADSPEDYFVNEAAYLTASGETSGYLEFTLDHPGAMGAYELVFVTSTTYTTAPIPEPETYALMLSGLGMAAFAARRGRKKAAAEA